MSISGSHLDKSLPRMAWRSQGRLLIYEGRKKHVNILYVCLRRSARYLGEQYQKNIFRYLRYAVTLWKYRCMAAPLGILQEKLHAWSASQDTHPEHQWWQIPLRSCEWWFAVIVYIRSIKGGFGFHVCRKVIVNSSSTAHFCRSNCWSKLARTLATVCFLLSL